MIKSLIVMKMITKTAPTKYTVMSLHTRVFSLCGGGPINVDAAPLAVSKRLGQASGGMFGLNFCFNRFPV